MKGDIYLYLITESVLFVIYSNSNVSSKQMKKEIFERKQEGKQKQEKSVYTGRLNKVGIISPRFDVDISEIEKWTNNLLPSRQFGYIVMITSGGIMDHEEARRKHLGGKILGFFS